MEKPNNPGMSEEAWKKLHKYISKLNIKYASELQKKQENKPA
ncbi:hypothetical protein ABE142_25195 [Paenibacillus alvei]|nr:hypothetical protein [Paenibacillus alvei]EJW19939.1 hypothetical protein PAV_1c09270 [Paenibacillus alvei DSM 29]MEC0081964.1 hypothetical protein [Paenibacillus alvei]